MSRLNKLMEEIEYLDRDLDLFLKGLDTRKVDPVLHDWVSYNDRRLNLLIRVVKILIEEE